jgi:hypothetical protein
VSARDKLELLGLIDRAKSGGWARQRACRVLGLDQIRDPEILRAELARVRHDYNTIRLHAAIDYVTPDDEHSGRGEKIRAARRRGLWLARRKRIEYHRAQRVQSQLPGLDDAR